MGHMVIFFFYSDVNLLSSFVSIRELFVGKRGDISNTGNLNCFVTSKRRFGSVDDYLLIPTTNCSMKELIQVSES